VSNSFSEYLSVLEEDDFEEKPVDLDTFLYSEDFLGLPKLSDYQVNLIETMTQVYRKDTLEYLWGRKEADRLWSQTFKEIIFMLGKGSGKDYVSSVAFARAIYLLMCLRDPAAYYGKPPGDAIALLNVAVNAQQAKNVFFKYLKTRIKTCSWFDGKWTETTDKIEFAKEITAYSGHSERESWEGYNLILVVLDEIAAFDTESSTSGDIDKTADAIYKMYRASVRSRFPKFGKIALLSFPRHKQDFMMQRYQEVVAEKTTEVIEYTFKIFDHLPDGTIDNEFTIKYEIDHIISYTEESVYALRRPSWYVNPTLHIEDYKGDFLKDREDTLSRFACMPPDAVDAYFKEVDKINAAFPDGRRWAFVSPPHDWQFLESFKPVDGKTYYMHVDLAHKHDRAAVALAHVTDWITVSYGNYQHTAPIVKLDAARWWQPTTTENVSFEDIEGYMLSLIRMGFKIGMITFDRWNSVDFQQRLRRNYEITTEDLSVAKPHYDDFKLALVESRIDGYDIPLLRDELRELRVTRGNKVDHPRKGSKDVSDAVVGAVYNCLRFAEREEAGEVEVRYLGAPEPQEDKVEDAKPKPGKMPRELEEFLESMQVIG
jgi:hypothetical protein